MKAIRRREFLGAAAAGGAALMTGAKSSALNLVPHYAFSAPQAADARIEILLNEKIGQISPDIYGHFVEHLGGVVYDGIWVGEDSKVPNVGGIRKELIDHMRRIKPSVVRWPGGCFADSYNWHDGVGPRKDRPRRTNFWGDNRGNRASQAYANLNTGPQKYEPNWFGTNEFMRFCKLIGHEALHRRQSAQPASQRLLRMGRILQRPGGRNHSLGHARRRRRPRAVQRRVLGYRQRIVGLRRAASRRKSTRQDSAASSPGRRASASISNTSPPGRTAATSTGRAASSTAWSPRARTS